VKVLSYITPQDAGRVAAQFPGLSTPWWTLMMTPFGPALCPTSMTSAGYRV
jgi:hypothetical protein